jgi:CubicO group peptidase (beta-lactamase class C family)
LLGFLLAAVTGCWQFDCVAAQASQSNKGTSAPMMIPTSGEEKPDFKTLDQSIKRLMQKFDLPGGEVSVSKDGQIVYSRGFGYADLDRKVPVQPDNVFRIASCSKPITATAIMKLVEEGKLRLDDRAFSILDNLKPAPDASVDPRLKLITVRNLLEHTGGWGRKNDDPQMCYARIAADTFSLSRPASPEAIVRYNMGKPLDFDPGTAFVYSNFGYNVLGRIIERVTGTPYEQYIKTNIFEPAGITDMTLGKTQMKNKLPKEVEYYDGKDAQTGWSLFSDDPLLVTVSYGAGYAMEGFDAHGGWIGSADDLVKFVGIATAVDPKKRILSDETLKIVSERPNLPRIEEQKKYTGKGWAIYPGKNIWTHSGALTYGCASAMYRLPNGVCVAVVFNHLPFNYMKFFGELEKCLLGPLENRKNW